MPNHRGTTSYAHRPWTVRAFPSFEPNQPTANIAMFSPHPYNRTRVSGQGHVGNSFSRRIIKCRYADVRQPGVRPCASCDASPARSAAEYAPAC